MRSTQAACCASEALVLASLMGGCTDLFHSTADIRTACEIDPSNTGCTNVDDSGGASADAGIDFCSWTEREADERAARVCAWLGSCEGPMGQNAFGPCVLAARLAYDCTANPSHRAAGKVHALWACLSGAQSCNDISRCIFPGGVEFDECASAGNSTQCGAAENADVRLFCVDGGALGGFAENCALWGQTCILDGGAANCGAVGAIACADSGLLAACLNTSQLHWCSVGGVDIGIDCTGNGSGTCGGFPEAGTSAWVACLPSTDAGLACDPTEVVDCSDGVAQTCPAAVPEQIDCAALLDDPSACSPGVLNPPFDWTSPCLLSSPCLPDSCDGSVLTGCARGASFSVDCNAAGLGRCQVLTGDGGPAGNAACAAP
ncbi:MAG: hypothetical protein ABSC94_23160 [Polyangiaceae bacterium]|jgi:hypothetical protein